MSNQLYVMAFRCLPSDDMTRVTMPARDLSDAKALADRIAPSGATVHVRPCAGPTEAARMPHICDPVYVAARKAELLRWAAKIAGPNRT